MLRKRPQAAPPHSGSAPNGVSPPPTAAALGILRALDPFAALDGAPGDRASKQPKHEHAHHASEDVGHGDEKKEKKGFWSSGRDRDREKAKEHEREKERDKYRKEDDSPAELTRMIGMCSVLCFLRPRILICSRIFNCDIKRGLEFSLGGVRSGVGE